MNDEHATIKEWAFIIGFVIALLFIFLTAIACVSTADRAERICKYFGGLQDIQDGIAVCKDGSEWALWE